MLGFRGLGYSTGFVLNMNNIVEELRSHHNASVMLVVGPDLICAGCPHHGQGKCLREADSEEKCIALDIKIMEKLGLEPGTLLSSSEARIRLREKITCEDMAELCCDCEWWPLGYCAEGLENLRSSSPDLDGG
jgi:uncharacterized protein